MAISIEWDTYIINVPQSFLSPLGGDSYNLDTNEFRIALRDIEDDEEGIPQPKTHNHNTLVTLSGIEYARVIEILSPYTITFEEFVGSPYRVFLQGSNNNILDVTNLNNVSVAPSNSGGLVQKQEIEDMSFGEKVYFDDTMSNTGTIYPTGKLVKPSSSEPSAKIIADARSLNTFQIQHDLTLLDSSVYDNWRFIGSGQDITLITIPDPATLTDCFFQFAEVTGYLSGTSRADHCLFRNITGLKGKFYNCMLGPGTITLNASGVAHFIDSDSGVPGTSTPIIDYNGTGSAAFRGFKGGTLHTNKTGTEAVSIDLLSGQVKLDLLGNFGAAGVEAGEFVVRGKGKVIEATTGASIPSGSYNGMTLINETYTQEELVQAVWDKTIQAGFAAEDCMKIVLAALAGKLSGADGTTVSIRDILDTVDIITATVDQYGNRSEVTLDVP